MSNDWRDGFLFVGNQLSLDFLNTRPVIDGNPVELLLDSTSLLRWLAAAGLLAKQEVNTIAKVWPAKADAILEKLRDFRETWRPVVLQLEAGEFPSSAFLIKLNELLAQHPFVDEIARSGPALKRRRRFDPRRPDDTFGPLLDETVNLLTTADRSRIRKCASCVLHFYDTSKKGTRRWCSMQICGNRFKVAAYSQRKRADQAGRPFRKRRLSGGIVNRSP
ncbi:MAG TPA: CGNR zinc finger domain-containing protein [Blastocatellia bacterium]|nr:CGNR zinc finger domain-containing protein [Blastocatellia bacterium]